MSLDFGRLRHSRDCVRAELPANYDRGGEVLTLGPCTCERDEIVKWAIERERQLRSDYAVQCATIEQITANEMRLEQEVDRLRTTLEEADQALNGDDPIAGLAIASEIIIEALRSCKVVS